MFDIGWSELVVIGIVALIAIGPKELPGVLRTVGQYMGKIRRMAAEFQGQFQEAMREAEMADLKKQVDEMTSAAQGVTDYDPLADIQKDFDTAVEDKPKESPAPAAEAGTSADSVSPEAAGTAVPAPAGELAIPQPTAETTFAAEAPQPKDEPKSGSGA